MKNLYLSIVLFLTAGCGLETPQSIPRLYPPNGVQVFNETAGANNSSFQIKWWGINPESEFSGYNVYYTDSLVEAQSYTATKLLCVNLNPSQATLPVTPPFNITRQFTFNVNKYAYGSTAIFENGKTYYFYVTAYNRIRGCESPTSLYSAGVFYD